MDIWYIHGFNHPLWLFFLCFLFGALFLIHKKYTIQKNFALSNLLEKVYGKQNQWLYLYIGVIFLMTILFFGTLAGPYRENAIQTENKNGVDIEIVFDLSYSMIASDIAPSRIDVAKQVLGNFIGKLSSDRVGLILFAGKPFQSVPLTYDYDFLKSFIARLGVDTIAQEYQRFQGTAIGDGLVLGSEVLASDPSTREKVMILITDGEANKGVDPELALKLLKEKHIKTYTIGIGKAENTTVTIPGPAGFSQKVLISGVDEVILKKIAQETGGKYFKADSSATFESIFDTIAQLEKRELKTEYYSFQKSQTWIFLLMLVSLFFMLFYFLFFKKIRF